MDQGTGRHPDPCTCSAAGNTRARGLRSASCSSISGAEASGADPGVGTGDQIQGWVQGAGSRGGYRGPDPGVGTGGWIQGWVQGLGSRGGYRGSDPGVGTGTGELRVEAGGRIRDLGQGFGSRFGDQAWGPRLEQECRIQDVMKALIRE